MNTDTASMRSYSNPPATPSDATRVFAWDEVGGRLRSREFVGTERQAAGFTVTIEGEQRENGMCRRWVSVWRANRDEPLPSQSARQLAAAISAAADEIENLR